MFTDPQSQQFAAFLRSFVLNDPAFQTALNDAMVDALGTVLTTRGDVLRRGSSDAERLALGAANAILSSDGTDVKYQTAKAIINAAIGSTQGAIFYNDASGLNILGPGTSGQFLKTQGASANPVWGDVASPVWKSITNSPFTISGDLTVTGLAGYQSIAIVVSGVTKASSGKIALRVSTDNGTSFQSTSGDYYTIADTTGAKTNQTEILIQSADTTGPSYGYARIEGFSLAAPKQLTVPFGLNYFIATTTALNAIKIISVGSAGALNGGTIYVLGLPSS